MRLMLAFLLLALPAFAQEDPSVGRQDATTVQSTDFSDGSITDWSHHLSGSLGYGLSNGAVVANGVLSNSGTICGLYAGNTNFTSQLSGNLSNFTIAAWVWVNYTTNTVRHHIFSFGGGPASNGGPCVRHTTNIWQFANAGVTSIDMPSLPKVVANTWMHVAMVVNPTTTSVYVNGVAQTETLATSVPGLTSVLCWGCLEFGASFNSGSMEGKMTNLKLIGRAWTQQDVLRDYEHKPRPGT